MIILFIAAIEGKRADNADHARSACAWLAKAPSWMTLPLPPVGAGSGLASTLAGAGSVAGAASGLTFGGAMGVSAVLLRSSWASVSWPALVSNAVSLSPATSSPPGSMGLTL
ncbi:hypothetical protein [Sphingomonas daechungensis]|uniref:hypothetical protein n=1 Tax=Sphingomonas daechungensis TaxID=1176646 RepID=UPI001CB8AFF8|nr:hypothetical protein [Sphingomonas daechungensis]